MKSKNTPTLSIITPMQGRLRYQNTLGLQHIDYELVVAPTWADGYHSSSGEFVTFLDKDAVLTENYFADLLDVFQDKPSFRKLAMVTPAVAAGHESKTVFGYRLTPSSVIPSRIRSSSELYLIQIGYIPGAIIRRSALGPLAPREADILTESVNLSIYFWNHGNRIAIEPNVIYKSTDKRLEFAFNVDEALSSRIDPVLQMWKREMVG